MLTPNRQRGGGTVSCMYFDFSGKREEDIGFLRETRCVRFVLLFLSTLSTHSSELFYVPTAGEVQIRAHWYSNLIGHQFLLPLRGWIGLFCPRAPAASGPIDPTTDPPSGPSEIDGCYHGASEGVKEDSSFIWLAISACYLETYMMSFPLSDISARFGSNRSLPRAKCAVDRGISSIV
jgi:hypothetical protein